VGHNACLYEAKKKKILWPAMDYILAMLLTGITLLAKPFCKRLVCTKIQLTLQLLV
jgi:hypothetical protein